MVSVLYLKTLKLIAIKMLYLVWCIFSEIKILKTAVWYKKIDLNLINTILISTNYNTIVPC